MGDKLKDKVAIVTGSGTGIGRGIAIAYAREGAHVVGAARRVEKLQETAKEVEKFGRRFLVVKCDISKKEDCENVARKTLNELGRIDILVNNAAIYPVTPFLEIATGEWDEVLGINLKGSVLMSRAVLPHMIERKQGKIIMVNSGQTRSSPAPYYQVHYVASKYGILGLTRCLASEFGPMGIQVNSLCPGYTPEVETALKAWATVMPPEAVEARLRVIPGRRFPRVKDYEGIAIYLASEDSDFMMGQTISVDGGSTMVA